MSLVNKKCVPCEGGIPKLTNNEISLYRKLINAEWMVVDNNKLERKFQFVNFKHTMEFVNRVAAVAEQEWHHPVMHTGYGECTLELWTHSINGLSENDFILAAKIDELV